MLTKPIFLTTSVLVLTMFPCSPIHGQPMADVSVIEVTVSYPGANCQVVADTIALPIEQQLNGVEGSVRIESQSTNSGKYTAHVYFGPNIDLASAAKLVQNRVALAKSLLPDTVQLTAVTVNVKQLKAEPNMVAIAVLDRRDHGWLTLDKAAHSVVQRLAAQNAITQIETFPKNEKQVSIVIDSSKCTALGLSVAEVTSAVAKAGAARKIDTLKTVIVRDKILLSDVATCKEVMSPTGVLRINRNPAVRIIGLSPQGKSVAESTVRCVEIGKSELRSTQQKGLSVDSFHGK